MKFIRKLIYSFTPDAIASSDSTLGNQPDRDGL